MYFSIILLISLCQKKKNAVTEKGGGKGEKEIKEKRGKEKLDISVKINCQVNASPHLKAGPYKEKYKRRGAIRLGVCNLSTTGSY